MIGQLIKAILNPMVLIGIACGGYIMMNNGMDYINQILSDPITYFPQTLGIIWCVSLFYATLFKPVYRTDTNKVNWLKTFLSSFNYLTIIGFSAALTCFILSTAKVDLSDRFDRYAQNIKVQDTLPELEE